MFIERLIILAESRCVTLVSGNKTRRILKIFRFRKAAAMFAETL
jgi:hypothetical protein